MFDPWIAGWQPALQHPPALRVRALELVAEQTVRRVALAVDGRDGEVAVRRWQCDQCEAGADELPDVPADETEQAVEIGLACEGAYDVVERLELSRPPCRRLVESGVLDRDRGLGRKLNDELVVVVGEVVSTLLLGQVEVAVGNPSQQDRHAEEAAHRRMVRRKPDRARIIGEVAQAQRPRLPDQNPEDSPAAGQLADRGLGLGIDARRHEALERDTCLVDDAERGVARAGQRGRGFDQSLQQ